MNHNPPHGSSSGDAEVKASSAEDRAPIARMTATRKRGAVLRLLRGEPLDIVAREMSVTASDLSGWRDVFLESGGAGLKCRSHDGRDTEIKRLM
ncbi:MAG: hypothetical protein GY847_14785 [Proteobacteria bacterium]|nr:hypothetical protein [Pseudomonadota bacterium]